MVKYMVTPIGYVQTSEAVSKIKESPQDVMAELVINPKYKDGLVGLDGFSHIIVLSFLTKLRDFERDVLQIRMRRFTKFGLTLEELPLIGVFASDSPNRPNPIAISISGLIDIKENRLKVKGLDLFDRTPILDIKPYTPERNLKGISMPSWYVNIISKVEEAELKKK